MRNVTKKLSLSRRREAREAFNEQNSHRHFLARRVINLGGIFRRSPFSTLDCDDTFITGHLPSIEREHAASRYRSTNNTDASLRTGSSNYSLVSFAKLLHLWNLLSLRADQRPFRVKVRVTCQWRCSSSLLEQSLKLLRNLQTLLSLYLSCSFWNWKLASLVNFFQVFGDSFYSSYEQYLHFEAWKVSRIFRSLSNFESHDSRKSFWKFNSHSLSYLFPRVKLFAISIPIRFDFQIEIETWVLSLITKFSFCHFHWAHSRLVWRHSTTGYFGIG